MIRVSYCNVVSCDCNYQVDVLPRLALASKFNEVWVMNLFVYIYFDLIKY